MKKAVFIHHHHDLDAKNIKAEYLKDYGVDVQVVNVFPWYVSLKPDFLRRLFSLFNIARNMRRVAGKNPDAVIIADQHQNGFACALAWKPCHTLIITDPQRYMNRALWILCIHVLLLHPSSRLYFLHRALLDECVKPLWGRSRMGVLEDPAPQLPLSGHTFGKTKAVDAVYVGRIVHDKNLSGLRRLLERIDYPFARVRVFGDGNDFDEIRDEFHASPLASRHEIIFEGWQKNPWKMIDRPSVVFSTSQFEGWCGVVQEAYASGFPVISTIPSAGTRFMLSEGRGLDLAGMDETAAADKARAFLNDAKALNECRRRAREWIAARAKINYGKYFNDTISGRKK